MKKIILLILCILISFSFISCTKNTNEYSEKNSKEIIENYENESKTETKNNSKTESESDVQILDSEKTVSKMYFDYNGFKIDINVDNETIDGLDEIEKNSTVPNALLSTTFGTINVIYEDNSKEVIGTIFIGDDGAYYLKLESNEDKNVAFKITDSSFNNGLF